MSQLTKTTSPPSEAGSLMSEMATAYRAMIDSYREHGGLTPQEAIAKADEPLPPEYHERILNCEPDQVTWLDLHTLAYRDPKLAVKRWEEVKQAARNELRSSQRAGKATEATSIGPWDRARFSVLREELAREWKPKNGIERTLIDTLAQAYTAYLYWLERLTVWSTLEPRNDNRSVKNRGNWDPPRVTDSEAIDQAAVMVDRFHRLLMRTLRALRDLRRYTSTVVVRNAGQVNVGEK